MTLKLEWNVENINDKYSVVRTNLGVATWTGLNIFDLVDPLYHFDKILKTLEDLHPSCCCYFSNGGNR